MKRLKHPTPPRTTRRTRLIVLATLLLSIAGPTSHALDMVRVSVKVVLNPNGERPGDEYDDFSEIRSAIREANEALAINSLCWRLQLVGLFDVQIAERFSVLDVVAGELDDLEATAMANPSTYGWDFNAINIYVAHDIPNHGGFCSTPVPSTGQWEAIAINSSGGILNDGAGWLHEIGHYLSLVHTFECYDSNCNENVCQGQGAFYEVDGLVSIDPCPDVCEKVNNLMSYESYDVDETEISSCQIDAMNRQLFDAIGLRGHVVGRVPVRVRKGQLQWPTVGLGIAAACPGDTVEISADVYAEAPMVIEKHVVLEAVLGAVLITGRGR